jgi:hypothetical protein
MGEFGSVIFAFNKSTKITKAAFTSCPNSVIKTNQGYYVGTHLYHMRGSSSEYIIKDIEKLKIIPDSIIKDNGKFEFNSRYTFIHDTSLTLRNNYLPFKFFYPKEIMVVASFKNNGKLFHIIDPREYKRGEELRLIATVINDTLKILDSLKNCTPETVLQFGNTLIINEEFYGAGFTMIRNDTIFKITFKTLHPNYLGPILEGYNLATDSSKKFSSNIEYTFNYEGDYNWKLPAGKPEREIKFDFNDKYKIVGYYGNGQDGNYIYINNYKTKLIFYDQWNFISNIFTYDNRLFVFFKNLGNIGFKYGLIEITDIDKFAEKYKE